MVLLLKLLENLINMGIINMAYREYCFYCGKCDISFNKSVDWDEIQDYKSICHKCKSNKDVFRDFGKEGIQVSDLLNNNPKTLGALADINSKKQGIQLQ